MTASDTSAEANRVQRDILGRADGSARLAMALGMGDEARAVTLAGIRHRHPGWTASAVHDELLRLMLGRKLASAALGARPPRG